MKFIIPLLTLVLAGCQATIPDNPNDPSSSDENHTVTKKTEYKTAIAQLDYIENDNKKPGEYPQQHTYIIANQIQAEPTILFKPIPYVTSKSINGWGTCYINPTVNFNNYFLAIIKNNKIIETFSSADIVDTCEKLKAQQLPLEEAQENARQEESIKKFTAIVDDPEKTHLFGNSPKNPEKTMKTQLNFFLEDPQSAEFKNVSVRKTFLISQNNVIYCYLVFANIRTKNISTGVYRPFQKAIFYIKDDKVLEHKIFPESKSGLKPKHEFVPTEIDNNDIEQVVKPRVKHSIAKKPLAKNIKKTNPKNTKSVKKKIK